MKPACDDQVEEQILGRSRDKRNMNDSFLHLEASIEKRMRTTTHLDSSWSLVPDLVEVVGVLNSLLGDWHVEKWDVDLIKIANDSVSE